MIQGLLRRLTFDREAMASTAFHLTEKLGPNRAFTPEGFLLCSNVPFARVGEMLYGPGETPVKVNSHGYARITRDARALFAPNTVASFNGKPVVNEHPDDEVGPKNWRQVAIGVVLNPRQGTGDEADVLLADLLLMDKRAIADVLAGKKEVSAGYEADYEQTGDGLGRQTNIIGNHIALVDRGRCGPRCAIGDHQPKESFSMKTKQRRTLIGDKIRQLFKDAGEELLADPNLLDEDGGDEAGDDGATHIHIHAGGGGGADDPSKTQAVPGTDEGANGEVDPVEARLQKLESGHEAIMQQLAAISSKLGGGEGNPPPAAGTTDEGGEDLPGAEGEDKTKAVVGDSAALETSFQELVSGAEILQPGYRLPTFDAKATRAATIDSMCATRRNILNNLYATIDGKTLLDGITGKQELSISNCGEAANIFRAAVGAKRLLNNAAATRDSRSVSQAFGLPVQKVTPVKSLADLNRLHAEHHKASAAQ